MIRVRWYFYILLGIVHILRNQPRGMGVPIDYASVICLTQYAISMTMFKHKTDYGGPRGRGGGGSTLAKSWLCNNCDMWMTSYQYESIKGYWLVASF